MNKHDEKKREKEELKMLEKERELLEREQEKLEREREKLERERERMEEERERMEERREEMEEKLEEIDEDEDMDEERKQKRRERIIIRKEELTEEQQRKLDELQDKLDKAQDKMDEAQIKIELAMDGVHEKIENTIAGIDFEEMNKSVENAMKNIDFEKINENVEKAMANIDPEKLRHDIEIYGGGKITKNVGVLNLKDITQEELDEMGEIRNSGVIIVPEELMSKVSVKISKNLGTIVPYKKGWRLYSGHTIINKAMLEALDEPLEFIQTGYLGFDEDVNPELVKKKIKAFHNYGHISTTEEVYGIVMARCLENYGHIGRNGDDDEDDDE